jgi:glucosamine--fructose-6-phosphate aminotransferase (isomerizing)
MCGIIGYVGNENAVPIIVEGLKKLEYRGYDSAGIAVFGADGFNVVKQKGRLVALESRLTGSPIAGTLGIGHTRWATHGDLTWEVKAKSLSFTTASLKTISS